MNDHAFLAFDLGAESGRAIIGILKDERMCMEEINRFPNIPARVGNHIYWDVLRLWNDIKLSISKACSIYPNRINSIGVDTWGVDYALIDKRGELLANPYHYRDMRTEGILKEIFKVVSNEEIYFRTGIQFMRINTLCQLYSSVRDESPILRLASKFLMMPDLFNFWLSGSLACEFTDATTTQFYNPMKNSWDLELLEKLNIPTHFLPEIVRPGTVLGEIDRQLATELNTSKEITIVTPACHDTASAVAAAPLADRRSAYISSGTWSLVGMEVESPVINRKSMAYNFTNEGGVFGKYRLLRNVQGMWLLHECKRIWASQGKEFSYEHLTNLASKARPFIAFIDPDDPRFISPANMVDEILNYVDQTRQEKPKDEGELVRIILESLALKYKIVIEQLMDLTGIKVERVNIVGGGSRNRLLNQLTANIMGIEVIAGPAEATSIGNLLMQAVAMGIIGTHEQLRSIVRGSYQLEKYEPSSEFDYDEAYQRFISIIGARTK